MKNEICQPKNIKPDQYSHVFWLLLLDGRVEHIDEGCVSAGLEGFQLQGREALRMTMPILLMTKQGKKGSEKERF